MELVVRKYDLLKELQLFQGIVERKNTIPILANVLLEPRVTNSFRDRFEVAEGGVLP
jgi:DNA polymerase III sliding clamp (beta) subunit (PCNA family)